MKKNFIVCHVIGMRSMDLMGDIARHIYNNCDGQHISCSIHSKKKPFADIYLLHNFIINNNKFVDFQKPHKNAKVISIIHSSMGCRPAKNSDLVVCLTEYWKQKSFSWGYRNTIVIPGCIYANKFDKEIDYNNQKFGRITRLSTGKINKNWNGIAERLLNKHQNSECHFFVDNFTKAPLLKHDRMFYDNSIKISEHDKKIESLSNLSMHFVMNGTFIDTFGIAILEGMAAGLATVIFHQPSISEVVGYGGISCKTIKDFERECDELMRSPKKRAYFGKLAKKRANEFSVENMVQKYNHAFFLVLGGLRI